MGGPIWIKFRRLVQNDMSTAVIWSKLKPEVEFQYGGHLHEFNVLIPEPRATLQDGRIPSAILKIVSRRILFFVFLMEFGLRRAAAFVSFAIHLS